MMSLGCNWLNVCTKIAVDKGLLVLISSCLYNDGKQTTRHKIDNNKSNSFFSLLRRFLQFAESVRLLEINNYQSFRRFVGHFAVYRSLKFFSTSSSVRFLFV